MTVIVAAVTGDCVTIAADRQITAGWQHERHSEPKIWTSDNGWAFGGSGSLRVSQVLKHHVNWPKYRPDEVPEFERFLVREVVEAVRSGVKNRGIIATDDGVEYFHGSLILASHDKLAALDGWMSVVSDTSGRMAIGSGYAEALGFLGDGGGWEEQDVVEAAKRAAATAVGVGGPFNVVNTATFRVRKVAGS